MSKLKLKKELERMSPEHLRELLLDLYDARKEAKEYLEFYINPDAAKIIERYAKVIDREGERARRGRRFRTTICSKAIKDFSSYGAGAEYEAQLMTRALDAALHVTASRYTDTIDRWSEKTFADMLARLYSAGLLDTSLAAVKRLIERYRVARHPAAQRFAEAFAEYYPDETIPKESLLGRIAKAIGR
ncbi:MAG: hypothetical protein K1V84_04760 [Muribaculaceae bacterium]